MKEKKIYTNVTGKAYNTGKKLEKAEKFEKEQKEAAEKLTKLKGMKTKSEKQVKKEEPQKEKDNTSMDTDDMTVLISDSNSATV